MSLSSARAAAPFVPNKYVFSPETSLTAGQIDNIISLIAISGRFSFDLADDDLRRLLQHWSVGGIDGNHWVK